MTEQYNPKRCLKIIKRMVGRKVVNGEPCDLTAPLGVGLAGTCKYCRRFYKGPNLEDYGWSNGPALDPPRDTPPPAMVPPSGIATYLEALACEFEAKAVELRKVAARVRLGGKPRKNLVPENMHFAKMDAAWERWEERFRPGTWTSHTLTTHVPACTVPPEGWSCSREAGHDGPCAASPVPRRKPAGGKKRSFRTKR